MSLGHILIIDDEASLRQTLARILQRVGFEVTTTASGQEGITLLSQDAFDLVYLDLRMPEINGLDALQQIHSKYPDLPVILFTAQPDLHSAVEALRRGATDYLLKPLKPQAVIDRTQAILANKQKERRKREIQRQIEALQAELSTLENESAPAASQAASPDDRFVKRGTLTMDTHTRRVTIQDQVVNLSPTSFDYLLVLARHSPNTVDYQTLVAEAQGYATEAREAQELTKWHVHNIRQAVETSNNTSVRIVTIRGAGYRLVVD
jgi:DNA-binding response OmpR family regulator